MPISGAKIAATNQETTSAMPTTANSENVYSPAALWAKPIGRNPTMVTSVPVPMGKCVFSYAKIAAFALSNPSSSLVTMDSTVIIASSTRSPSAMMSAPSETRWKLMCARSIATKTTARTSGMEQATTAPARNPRLSRLTAITMAIASHNVFMNSPTA